MNLKQKERMTIEKALDENTELFNVEAIRR